MLAKKKPRDGALPKALDAGFVVSGPGGGAIQPGSILVMFGSLATRSPERVVNPPDQHA
jgi:hypothetical protein